MDEDVHTGNQAQVFQLCSDSGWIVHPVIYSLKTVSHDPDNE